MYSAFITLVFLIMYFVTGFLMGKGQWFQQEKPEPIIKTLTIKPDQYKSMNAFIKHLQDTFKIGGHFTNQGYNHGKAFFEFYSLKRFSQVELDSIGTTATLKEQPKNTMMAITAYHRANKYQGGLAFKAYILFMDLSSIALLIFAITGVYMWMNLIKYRFVGWVFLLGGTGYAIFVWLTFLDLFGMP